MTDTERLLNLNYSELRRTDVSLLSIECMYRRDGNNRSAKEIHNFRQEYLIKFMTKIKKEKIREDKGDCENDL